MTPSPPSFALPVVVSPVVVAVDVAPVILHGGATATLVNLVGSAVIYALGAQMTGVSVEINVSYLDAAYVGVREEGIFSKSGLVDYIVSGPVVAMAWEGKNVVTIGRKIIGATNPAQSAPETIRGDYAIDIGSDSVENGRKEIALWFPEGTVQWQSSVHPWIYE